MQHPSFKKKLVMLSQSTVCAFYAVSMPLSTFLYKTMCNFQSYLVSGILVSLLFPCSPATVSYRKVDLPVLLITAVWDPRTAAGVCVSRASRPCRLYEQTRRGTRLSPRYLLASSSVSLPALHRWRFFPGVTISTTSCFSYFCSCLISRSNVGDSIRLFSSGV